MSEKWEEKIILHAGSVKKKNGVHRERRLF